MSEANESTIDFLTFAKGMAVANGLDGGAAMRAAYDAETIYTLPENANLGRVQQFLMDNSETRWTRKRFAAACLTARAYRERMSKAQNTSNEQIDTSEAPLEVGQESEVIKGTLLLGEQPQTTSAELPIPKADDTETGENEDAADSIDIATTTSDFSEEHDDEEQKIVDSKARTFLATVNSRALPHDRFVVAPKNTQPSDVAGQLIRGYFVGVEQVEAVADGGRDKKALSEKIELGKCALSILCTRGVFARRVTEEWRTKLPEGTVWSPKLVLDTVAASVADYSVESSPVVFDWPARRLSRTSNDDQQQAARAISRHEHAQIEAARQEVAAAIYRQTRNAERSPLRVEVDYPKEYVKIVARLAGNNVEKVGYCTLLNISSGLQRHEGAEDAAREALRRELSKARNAQGNDALLLSERRLLYALAGVGVGLNEKKEKVPILMENPPRLHQLKVHRAGGLLPAEIDAAVSQGLKKLVRIRGTSA